MTRSTYDWDAIVQQLRKNPGRWTIALRDVPVSVEKLVRLRRNPKLRLHDGRILADARNVYGPEGNRRCDLALKFQGN